MRQIIVRAVPLIALAGACTALFFGQDTFAKPWSPADCVQFLPATSVAYRQCMARPTYHVEENYNDAQCGAPVAVAPCDGEESHWVATRWQPSAYPFLVTDISYTLLGNRVAAPGCDSTLAHKVSLYRGGTSPASVPSVIETINVQADPTAKNDREVWFFPTKPVDLNTGEYLYVSIQNAGNAIATPGQCNNVFGSKFTCASTCQGVGRGNQSWWSNANAPAFSWQTLASFTPPIAQDVRVAIGGYHY